MNRLFAPAALVAALLFASIAQAHCLPGQYTRDNSSGTLVGVQDVLCDIKTDGQGQGVAQGSVTAGQTGGLVQGAVTTANPSYVTSRTSPLSLTPDGKLRVLADTTASETTPAGIVRLTGLSAVTAFSRPTGSTVCVFTVETQSVRWRDDGVNPSPTIGFPLAAGRSIVVRGISALSQIKFIEQAASAVLYAACYH
jgi:hypothetical protein